MTIIITSESVAITKRRQEDEGGGTKKKGRIHDPVHGECCHWCRQKTVEDHVKCSTSSCPLQFCGLCLRNRHGENVKEEMQPNVLWVCPRCRGGCGAGCIKTCCNCGPCRKSKHLPPTGQLVRVARTAGFSNVHDYLVHLETGESPMAISKRKEGHRWTSRYRHVKAEHHSGLTWAKRRPRSPRFLRVNTNWGHQTPMRWEKEDQEVIPWEEQIRAARLVLATLTSTWEIGRKLKKVGLQRASWLS